VYLTEPLSVLVVEDEPVLRGMLETWLKKNGYRVFVAADSSEAERVLEMANPQLMMLDICLPGERGIDFLERISPSYPQLGVLISSAEDDTGTVVRAMKLGAFDYIVKPYSLQTCLLAVKGAEERWQLRTRMQAHQQVLERTVTDRTRQIETVQDTTVFLMAKLAQSRDDETGLHLDRMRFYTNILAKRMTKAGYDEIDDEFLLSLYRASPLHDIGKVGIPDAILLKPGKLTPDEFELMKTHTTLGADCLAEAIEQVPPETAGFLQMGFVVTRSHHENFDGSGYPDGLRGDEIPLAARILSVADFYDALAFPRIYRPTSVPHQEIIDTMKKLAGVKFDPDIVDLLLEVEGEFRKVAAQMTD
jgi:putative two-component system response regulator